MGNSGLGKDSYLTKKDICTVISFCKKVVLKKKIFPNSWKFLGQFPIKYLGVLNYLIPWPPDVAILAYLSPSPRSPFKGDKFCAIKILK